MQRTLLKNEQQGEGIYAENQQFSYNIETEACQKEASEQESLSNLVVDHHQTDGNCGQSNSIGSSNRNRKHLNATQQVLDVLDQQIDTLNKLKRTETNTTAKQIQSKSDRKKNFGIDNPHLPLQLLPVKQRSCSQQLNNNELNSDREFLLNHYIRRSIDETGECGCHFEQDFSCYPNCNQQLPSNENYNFIKEECVIDESSAVFGSDCDTEGEYSIRRSDTLNHHNNNNCDNAQLEQHKQLSVENNDGYDENYDSVNVCFALTTTPRDDDGNFDGCCDGLHGHRLLIDEKLGGYDDDEADFLTGPAAAAPSDIERDSDPEDLGTQEDFESGVRLTHELCCRCCCKANIHDQKDSANILSDENENYSFTVAENDYNNYLTAIETIGRQTASASNNRESSFKLADEELCAIDSQVDRANSGRCFEQETHEEQAEADEDSCESELGNALEGLVDSLNSEPSSPTPPLFKRQPFTVYRSQSSSAEGSTSYPVEPQTNLLDSLSNIERLSERPSCNNSSANEQKIPLVYGFSIDPNPSLSRSQDFSQASATRNEHCSDYISADLRRQLYCELNARFLQARAKQEDNTLESSQYNSRKRLLSKCDGATNWARGPYLAGANNENKPLYLDATTTAATKIDFTRRFEYNNRHIAYSHEDVATASISRSCNLNYMNTDAPCRVGKSDATKACTSECNYCRVADQQQQQHQRGEEEGSMKAVRDIAKVSVPSLASLQYLPNRIESTNKLNLTKRKTIDKKETIMEPNKSEMRNAKSQVSRGDGNSVAEVIAESKEDIKHEQSGLLHNLCLCNCMAKSQDVNASQRRAAHSSSSSKSSRDESRIRTVSSPKKNAYRSVKGSSKSSHASECSSPNIEGQQQQSEKQSPSFLNILKFSAHVSHNTNNVPSHQRTNHRGPRIPSEHLLSADGRRQRTPLQRNAVGNSVGDLEATESCCSSGRDSVDTDATRSGSSTQSFLRARSTSFASNDHAARHHHQLRASSSCANNDSLLLADPSDGGARAQSACSPRDVVAAGSDRIAVGRSNKEKSDGFSRKQKKLSSFFGSPITSDLQIVAAPEQQQQPTKKDKNKKRSEPQKSFFTRSLNRLSKRKQAAETQIEERDRPQSSVQDHDHTIVRSACASPTISISTVSKYDEPVSDSVNSLADEVSLSGFTSPIRPRSSSLLKPASHHHKHHTSSNRSVPNSVASCCDMTRAKSCKLPAGQREASGERDTYDEPAKRIARYGSEISYCTSEHGSDARAYSLPASPHAGLRRDLCANRNRSPRLTQSPVPFPSPANESTKIEDGLKVCSTEHFEKHIGNIKGNQTEAQKRLFKAWINHYCPNLIQHDLVEEFKDGIKLIGLLAALTRDKRLSIDYHKLVRDKQAYVNRLVVTPTSRLRHLSNVSIVIDYLRKNLNMKLINLNPMDIVSGKPNVTLGLCWNIILNFQLEQNFLRHSENYPDSISQYSSSDAASNCTSRLSPGFTNEDTCARDTRKQQQDNRSDRSLGGIEEYSPSDLVVARKKLLDNINKRFNLKLTNLTSNLLDGDVLSIIIKQLAPNIEQDIAETDWRIMSNDEKLDFCFVMAHKRLQIPRLFSASDLKYQIETDSHSKPLLVYLSMLLKTPKASEGVSALESTSDPRQSSSKMLDENCQNYSIMAKVRDYINEIDRDDKFEVDKLQSTLEKIKQIQILYEELQSDQQAIDENLVASCKRLTDEASQVESLISWINQADNLFETKHKSAADLTDAIDQYRMFFSSDNVPQVTISLCPTLERQYRECLSSAKQRVLLMEQTLKNWYGYEKARQQLKEWLTTAETKLVNALGPATTASYRNHLDNIQYLTERLEDLIDYFELEPIDSILMNDNAGFNATFLNHRLPSLESIPSSLLSLSMNESISGSALSIGSSSSRISTLQTSKKATYNKLFDDFELKCRLLAAQLDSDQRDALLLGVRELKYRLRYITEQRVPQAVSELKFNIVRCEMCIEELDESSELSQDGVIDSCDEDINEASPLDADMELDTEFVKLSCADSYHSNEEPSAGLEESGNLQQSVSELKARNIATTSETDVLVKKPSEEPVLNANVGTKISHAQQGNKSRKAPETGSDKVELTVTESNESWSFFGWLLTGTLDKKPEVVVVNKSKSKKKHRSGKPNNKNRNKNRVKLTNEKSKVRVGTDDSSDKTFTRLFWSKLVRAYRASMPYNIMLLICLAGICVLPMMQKDACCELTAQNHIPSEDLSLNIKPT